jgi:F0F1-type ATP synthase assembly protein I
MSYAASAALSILIGIGAVVVVIAVRSGVTDVVGGTAIVLALVVFMRAVISLAGDSGDQPPSAG